MPGDERPLEQDLRLPGVPGPIEGGDLTILGLLPNSSNYTFLARATDADGEEMLTVYKPRRGESPLWDFREGSLGHREVAAFVVASALGWPDVPTTVLRDGPEGPGSVQRFVPFEPHEHYFTLQERFPDAFRAIATFDLLVNNADRKGGHCLLGEDGRIWAIDHGVCFHEDPKLRTVIWEYIGEPIPAPLLERVDALGRAIDAGAPPDGALRSLLDPGEVAALRRRIGGVLTDPVFPEPTGERPYPWPPV